MFQPTISMRKWYSMSIQGFSMAVLLLLVAGCEKGAEDKQVAETAEMTAESLTPVTDWTLTDLAGKPVTLSDYQSQPVLLVFWATWCPYCKKLLPGIQRLHEKYHAKGLKIIAVNIREDWKPAVYWRNHEYTFDSVLEGDAVAEKYGIRGTPGLVFIAPGGEVLATQSFSDPEHPSLEKFAAQYTQSKAE